MARFRNYNYFYLLLLEDLKTYVEIPEVSSSLNYFVPMVVTYNLYNSRTEILTAEKRTNAGRCKVIGFATSI